MSAIPEADRTALVTGANSGMGKETARVLASMGTRVLLACRDVQRGHAAANDIIGSTGNTAVTVIKMDLASLETVRRGAAEALDRFGTLDVLVNNAAASLRTREVTIDGFERHWATNVLGPYLLTTLLLPALRATGRGRVVSVSTVAARGLRLDDTQYDHRRFNGTSAYLASKQAARMLAWSLAEQVPSSEATINCVNPGYVLTDLTLSAGPLVRALVALTKFRAQTPLEGADSAIWAATSPDVAGLTGRFWNRRRETHCRFRDPAQRGLLQALVDQQLAAVAPYE